jgi:hypothetical protein
MPRSVPPPALPSPLCWDLEALAGAEGTLTLAGRCSRVFAEFHATPMKFRQGLKVVVAVIVWSLRCLNS